jgi:hypothetical protein
MAQIGHYDVGEYWIPQATFKVGSTNTDPTTLTVRQQAPDGTETVLANAVAVSGLTSSSTPVAKTAAGVFKLNPGVLLTTSGYWFVRFEGGGAVVATEEHQAIADPSEFTSDAGVSSRALVSLPVTKDWLEQKQISTGDDLDLVRTINDVSDAFYEEAGWREFKVFGANPQTRTFAVEPGGSSNAWYIDSEYQGERSTLRRTVRVGDLASYTQVQILDRDWATVLETVASAGITAHPINRPTWAPIRELEFQTDVTALSAGMRVSIAGNFGFPSVPGDVRRAVLDAVAASYDRPVEHYRTDLGAVKTGGGGNVVVVGGGRQQLLSLPPETLAVAWRYRDPVIG